MTEVSRVSLDKQIEEMLVPTEKVVQIRKGKKISKGKNLFSWIYNDEGRYFRRNFTCYQISL